MLPHTWQMLLQQRLSFLARRTANSPPRKTQLPLSTAVLWKPTSRVGRGRRENLARILGWGPAGVARAGPGSGAPAPRAPTFRPSSKPGVPGSRPRAESTPTCCARVKQTFPEPRRKSGPHWPLGSARAQFGSSSVGSGPFAHNT